MEKHIINFQANSVQPLLFKAPEDLSRESTSCYTQLFSFILFIRPFTFNGYNQINLNLK